MHRNWIVLAAISFLLIGCSLDATILHSLEEASLEEANRPNRDYVNGEIVPASSGYQVIGAFGEVSEKQITSNGWKVDAVFYE